MIGSRVDKVKVHIWSLIHVRENESGANGGFGVKTRTTVAVTACSDLEVEGAVNSVFLCTEDGCQMLRHLWLRVCVCFPLPFLSFTFMLLTIPFFHLLYYPFLCISVNVPRHFG